MGGAVAIALEVLQALPALLQAGVQVEGFINNAASLVGTLQTENREPTQAEWDAIRAERHALEQQATGQS